MSSSIVYDVLHGLAELVERECGGGFKHIRVGFGASYDSTKTSEETLSFAPGRSYCERVARGSFKRSIEAELVLVAALANPGSAEELDLLSVKLESAANALVGAVVEAGGLRWVVEDIEVMYPDPTILEQNLIYNGRVEVNLKAHGGRVDGNEAAE